MSLTGNLEDLPLLDILQIVSFSKKTGYLAISSTRGEGAIVFRDGFVVCSFSEESPPLDEGLARLPLAERESAIRRRIEIALEQLIRLREGQFNFSLTEEPPTRIGPRDVSGETLEAGINAQELLLDLARGMDEDRRDSSAALEASFAQPQEESFEEDLTAAAEDTSVLAAFVRDARVTPAPAGADPTGGTMPMEPVLPEAPPPVAAPAAARTPPAVETPPSPPVAAGPPAATAAELRTLLLVDDEEDVRRTLSEHFTRAGYQVLEAEDPDSAVKKANRLGKAGIEFLLVADLGMPTSGGASFHGGFEVVKRLGKMHLHPPVLVMTESLSGALQARAKQMGIASVVFKPGLSKLDPEQFQADLRAFAGRMVEDILPKLTQPASATPKGAVQQKARPPAPPRNEELSRHFALLQRRLEELRRPGDATQISILVMKTAREFFERAVLFLVKNEVVRGLGGFGPAPKAENINLVAREVVIPLSEPSIFRDVAAGRKPVSGPLADGKWGQYLLGKIGRFRSNASAILPLLTHRETIALLYGDNPETGRELGRLDALEVFLNQAGVAIENVFLQRKIEDLQQRGSNSAKIRK